MKKNGFTLVELVVGIAVSSLILAMLGTLIYFTTTSNSKIITDEAKYNDALRIKNLISNTYDQYNDETLTIETTSEYTSLFKTNTHNFKYLNQSFFLDDNEVYVSKYDTKIEVKSYLDTITYNINYDETSYIRLVKGRYTI